MVILFSAKVSTKHQDKLKLQFPKELFIFCDRMDEAIGHMTEAEVLVTYGEDLTDEIVSQTNKLKWIMVLSAGMDTMPFAAIDRKDILVTNARGIHKVPMAEYAISSILQVSRQTKQLIFNQENHVWDRSIRMQEITGKTILIAGTGAIGQEVARLAKAFHMITYGVSRSGRNVEFFDKNVTAAEINTVLPESDFLVSVLPSTPETKGFFTKEHFKLLPDHAAFLNMGRGDAVTTDVLQNAIQSKEIAHAILDVAEEEPLPVNHPLWDYDNVTITPHLSGISPHYQKRALEIFTQNMHTYQQGKTDLMINKINLSRGY
ncbi:D-2-hydroxyacid dehydrogenase [Virgibacillus phasianinus]|uniref:D-2-hydroxyacid dehydrogenase n=1 Tax=Virgibacillus phasianinus TaxID=2017483 RepID=A0A220TZ51_9BACI|nr:D-2-hydroxyacid dehydrogenase [Virgibacillus phasianinus]ASK61042.1 D-2-hydroxyacid dehydrogenase [Virgibacillus phasianinus]